MKVKSSLKRLTSENRPTTRMDAVGNRQSERGDGVREAFNLGDRNRTENKKQEETVAETYKLLALRHDMWPHSQIWS